MDYQLNVYPSSEGDLQNVKTLNAHKQIKSKGEIKLAASYKKTFTPAVKKYNERAISGKLIDDYYKAICASNIPEVYKLSLVIRYELLNKEEIAAIEKAFVEYKKVLEKEPYLCIVATYHMSFEEFKELQIYFYPICDNYVSGLSMRNDLIDVTKQLCDVKDNINIVKAMPLFVKHLDGLFAGVNNGKFYSQAELEAMANKKKDAEDPFSLHSIAVETLKGQMNSLQRVNAENHQLEDMIQKEKERIEYDIEWSKKAEEMIYKKEEERLIEEERKAAALRKAEQERLAQEAQARELERLREEERRLEAARLAEMARRNIEMRRRMSEELEATSMENIPGMMPAHSATFSMDMESGESLYNVNEMSFQKKIEQHLKWQEFYEITEDTKIEDIPKHALEDVRRLNGYKLELMDESLPEGLVLIGVNLRSCKLTSCILPIKLVSSNITDCTFINSDLSDASISKCIIDGTSIENMVLSGITMEDTTVLRSNFSGCQFKKFSNYNGVSYNKTKFINTLFEHCDMKKNVFSGCDLTNAMFKSCDFREAVFQSCKLDGLQKEGSVLRGVKYQ